MTKKAGSKTKKLPKKVVLLILDGWGLGEENEGNAIYLAKTPFMDSLYKKYPWTKINASGKYVGLPANQVGNSEAGHINIGAGRIVDQDVVKISKQINTGEFFKNPAFVAAINHIKKEKSALHIIGMISNNQSPHSDPNHLLALLSLARQHKVKNIYLHLFTDGRDSPPRSSLRLIEALERQLKPNEIIATVIGRFYAMDRKKNWSSTWWAYEAMTSGQGHKAKSPQEGITRAYNAGITDEFIEPIVLYKNGKIIKRISNNDAIIFFNLRSDRARQMAKPFVQSDFEKNNLSALKRKKVLKNIVFVAMTDFGPDLDSILTAYPSEDIKDSLPVLLKHKTQIYIAEKEKYAHVTYFVNGGYADPVNGEKRLVLPSPSVPSYEKTPAMSTPKVAQAVIKNIKKYDFICANISSPDMIGHTGNLKAGIKAAEIVDKYIKKIYQVAMKEKTILIITADHGNLEYMLDVKTREVVTEHTSNPVPFILIDNGALRHKKLKAGGCLSDIAPTILKIFDIKKSKLMKGDSLI
ncbi:MAG: 2,3-bisphosphoglycerate-independent phosphoglycerate mutase [Candidatus Buchananbacteria bacterium]|nr:2,3-bisphosphoglycerate-independent phosphoglycerate mutase [Candidatus Buchananbacteria bacterium]